MGADKVKEKVSAMRRDIAKRRKNAAERFTALTSEVQETRRFHEHEYEYTNPSRARINEVLAALFHKAPSESNGPEHSLDEALVANDPA